MNKYEQHSKADSSYITVDYWVEYKRILRSPSVCERKIKFPTKLEAAKRAEEITTAGFRRPQRKCWPGQVPPPIPSTMYYYKCPHCTGYHLTKKPRSEPLEPSSIAEQVVPPKKQLSIPQPPRPKPWWLIFDQSGTAYGRTHIFQVELRDDVWYAIGENPKGKVEIGSGATASEARNLCRKYNNSKA